MARVVNRRRPRLVDRPFQFGIAWRMMIAYLLFLFGGLVLVFGPSMITLTTGGDSPAVEPAARELLVLRGRIWPAALFIFGGVFVYTLIVSHYVAGPIFRINAALRRMLGGDYPDRVTLRRGDHFQATADLLTALSRKLAAERERRGEPAADRENVTPGHS